MKKIVAMALVAATFAACNSTTPGNASTDSEPVTTTSTNNNAAYAPDEGDVTRRDGRVMVYRNGQWVETNEELRMDDDVVITTNGRAVKDGYERELREGETVTRTGEFLDRTGESIENAWDDTKEGVKKAGEKIGDAAKKAGDKLERATDRDRDN